MNKKNVFKNGYNRRSIIKALGASAAAPFVPVLSAEAQEGNAPKRFLVVVTPNGFGDGAIPQNPGSNYTHGSAFAPLNAYREDMSILRGVGFTGHPGGGAPGPIPGDPTNRTFTVTNGHTALAPHLLTAEFTVGVSAASTDGEFHAEGRSIDQEISQRLMANDATKTNLPYIYAGVKTDLNLPAFSNMVYDEPMQVVSPQVSAESLQRAIFGGGGSSESQSNDVIAYARAQIEAVKGVLSTEDVQKMDAHLEGIVELEKRLGNQANGGNSGCGNYTLQEESGTAEDRFRIDGENMMDLIVQAFACDQTRVGTLIWSNTASTMRFAGAAHTHHECTHHGSADVFLHDTSPTGMPASRDIISTWYANRFTYLLDKLKSIPEGDGTMLDNTFIIWASEHTTKKPEYGAGSGEHNRSNIPFLLAGSAGGAVKQGQFIDFNLDTTNYPRGRGHGDVFVTALHAMGVANPGESTFGLPGLCNGPITELLS